jgi:hypothetical protein
MLVSDQYPTETLCHYTFLSIHLFNCLFDDLVVVFVVVVVVVVLIKLNLGICIAPTQHNRAALGAESRGPG